MIKEITMPAGGQTTDTSVIGCWLVKKGDKVKRGDALLEIETDKATLTVESYANGTLLALLAEEGDEKKAGEVIALIGDEKDMEEAEARAKTGSNAGGALEVQDPGRAKEEKKAEEVKEVREEAEYQPVDKTAPRIYEGAERGGQIPEKIPLPADYRAMPNAKKAARENHVMLEDVAKYVGKQTLNRWDVKKYVEDQAVKTKEENRDEVIKHTTMRKVIARRMVESASSIPVFAATVEVEMTECIRLRTEINAMQEGKVSYNDILFKCMEAALRKYPYVNASYTEEAMIVHKDVNIGLAVAVDGGLVVPVVKQVNAKNIREISRINSEHIEKARSGKLSPEEMTGGTITLSSLGGYPVQQFQAIINPPESCILAVAAMEDKPVYREGEWKPVRVMKITGSFDHRIIDGAYAAQFLAELKKIIENPALALL